MQPNQNNPGQNPQPPQRKPGDQDDKRQGQQQDPNRQGQPGQDPNRPGQGGGTPRKDPGQQQMPNDPQRKAGNP
jgi:hypothetical protein